MSDTPRMVIVPADPSTDAIVAGASEVFGPGLGQDAADQAISVATQIYRAMIPGSPNAGKIRRADLERAKNKAAGAVYDIGMKTPSRQQAARAWQDAFVAALGLEIAEDGENG